MLCDFCTRPLDTWKQPAWRLPAKDFVVPDTGGDATSEGDWLACEPCRRVVEKRDPKALADYVFNDSGDRWPQDMVVFIKLFYENLYPAFFAHWDGTVEPYMPKETDGLLTEEEAP